MLGLIKTLVGVGGTFLQGKMDNKKAEIEGRNNAIQEKLKQSGTWDEIHAKNSGESWKDEWFTLLFSIPLVLAFIPSAVPYVEQGFKVLDLMPDWYKQALAVLVAASVGYQKLTQLFTKKAMGK
jgi:hypothetical protein|tara:strand:- start:171 stop:542 length:372 start_codon:yes stop_codon:yes gene_type:complete